QPAIECRNNMAEIMAVVENETGCRDHRISTRPACETRVFLDSIERKFARLAVNGKDRLLGRKIDRIIPPFSVANFAAIEGEYFLQLVPVEGNDVHRTALGRAGPGEVLAETAFASPSMLRFGIFLRCLQIVHGCPAPRKNIDVVPSLPEDGRTASVLLRIWGE